MWYSWLKRLGVAHVNDGLHSFTCHPHIYRRMEWTILLLLPSHRASLHWPVLIAYTVEDRRRSTCTLWHCMVFKGLYVSDNCVHLLWRTQCISRLWICQPSCWHCQRWRLSRHSQSRCCLLSSPADLRFIGTRSVHVVCVYRVCVSVSK